MTYPDPQGPELEHRGTVRYGFAHTAQELEEGRRMLLASHNPNDARRMDVRYKPINYRRVGAAEDQS